MSHSDWTMTHRPRHLGETQKATGTFTPISTNYVTLVTLKRRWDTPTDASAMMVVHRLLSSAMRSNDDDDWPVHSLMLSLPLLRGFPLWGLPSTAPCSMITGSVQTTDMTKPYLNVHSKSSWRSEAASDVISGTFVRLAAPISVWHLMTVA